MKLGVLSDSHENLGNLHKAVQIFQQHGIATIIHCGDMTTPATAAHLDGFRVIHVTGNMDHFATGIRRTLLSLNPKSHSGASFSGTISGVKIAAAHGHLPFQVHSFMMDGSYQYIFHGHTHQQRDEMVGQTRVINPGALGGKGERRTVCVIDLGDTAADGRDPVQFIEL